MAWRSFHVFLHDPAAQERWLVERLPALLATARPDGWFFIRYWEGGPHLRLRLAGDLDPAVIGATLRDGLAGYAAATPLTRDTYYAGHGFDGAPVDPAALPWHADATVAAIDYEPEIGRYGGPAAMAASERLFEASSALALAVTAATPGDLARRLGVAFGLMAATLTAVGYDAAGLARGFDRYAAFWAGHSPANYALAARLAVAAEPVAPGQVAALRRLLAGCAVGAEAGWTRVVRRFADELAGIDLYSPFGGTLALGEAARADVLDAVLVSQIHMLNNRLGVTPPAELVLATKLSRAAAALAAAPREMAA